MSLTGKITNLFADKAMTIPAFPRTKIKAVSDDNGVGLDAILNEMVHAEEYSSDVATVPLNADTLGGQLPSYYAQAPIHRTLTISASGWSSGVPYTQTISVSGILATDSPHISPVYSDDLETALAQKEAWAMVSRGKTAANSITFLCFEDKPEVDIPVQIEVNR